MRSLKIHWYKSLALLIAFWMIVPVVSTTAHGGDLRLIASSDEQIVFEITPDRPVITEQIINGDIYISVSVAGCDNILETGEPMLPVGQTSIALPPGKDAVLSIIAVEEELLTAGRPLPCPDTPLMDKDYGSDLATDTGVPPLADQTGSAADYFADPAIYEFDGIYPSQLVALEPSLSWRHLRLQPVSYYPVRFDARSTSLIYYSRFRVQVTFVSTAQSRSERPQRPVPAPEPRWEPIYQRRLLNYNQAAFYKRAPLPVRVESKSRGLYTLEADFEIRLDVERTGLLRVAYADLAATGAFSEPVSLSELSLVVGEYDGDGEEAPIASLPVAFYPEDLDNDQLFGPGDALIFYGQDAWDCFDLTPGQKRYGRANVYWLRGGAGAPLLMPELPDWYDVPDLSSHVSAEQTRRFEENQHYIPNMLRNDGSSREGHLGVKTKHYLWTDPVANGPDEQINIIEYSLPNLLSISSIDIHLQAIGARSPSCRLWFSETSGNDITSLTPADTAWAVPGSPFFLGSGYSQAISITDGLSEFPSTSTNGYLKIYLPMPGDGLDNMTGSGLGIDWFSMTYEGRFRLAGGMLQTDLVGTEVEQVRLRSLDTSDILLFDLTNGREPNHIPLSAERFTPDGSTKQQLIMQIDFGETEQTKTLLYIERAEITGLSADKISLTSAQPLPPFAGEDLVMIYPRRFADELSALVTYRTGQGHNVYLAPIEDLYYAYSSGRPHPYAIKRFMRDLWANSDPAPDYLLLVGDGSNDIAGYLYSASDREEWQISDEALIPVMTTVGHMPGTGSGYHISCSDQWFVDSLGDTWGAHLSLPDLHIGRIPCSDEEELSHYISKVITYESDEVTASWRNRLLVHSDDFFSRSGSNPYRFAGEYSFIAISKECVDSVRAVEAFDHYNVETFYQSDIMDSLFSLGRCRPDPDSPGECLWLEGQLVLNTDPLTTEQATLNTGYGTTTAKNMLLESINSGLLIWAFQGHSNQKLLTHEMVFYHASNGIKNVFELTNINRPYFFIGSGCHLADFSDHREGGLNYSGDAMTEVMLFCCDDESKGAIGVFASTDYEQIGHRIELDLFSAMFTSPPVIDGEIQWRLGELITEGKLLVSSNPDQRFTYTYLGDPTLRMGISPPVFSLTLNDEPWLSSTGESYISTRSDDSLSVTVTAYDESTIPLPQITDFGGQVSEEMLTIETNASGGRVLVVNYSTQIQRRPYELVISTPDREGSSRQMSIDIPFNVAFYEQVGEDLTLLSEGSLVQSSSLLQVTVRAGAHLSETDFDLYVDGESFTLLSAEKTEETGEPYVWTLKYGALTDLPLGQIELELRVNQHDGSVLPVAGETIEIGEDDLRFKNAWWIPSPFADEATLVYDLSKPGTRVRLRLFTTSGKCILDQDSDDHEPNLSPSLPTTKGIIAFAAPVWDGRDDDGDPVANGLYFFELSVWDEFGNKTDTVLDKLVRVQ